MGKRTKIRIDTTLCGDGFDPRACRRCLQICAPAVFHLHQSFYFGQTDSFDPEHWQVTPMWPSLCTRCRECVEACPQGAIRVSG
jgi:NAD-dependent dihydropyrimidine dehydrogenase PreA subunit